METETTLPKWLDTLIFDDLGAQYRRSNTDMTVIDWDKSQILNYLGTYFPRSYAESTCLFNEYILNDAFEFRDAKSLNILDFGCGTGGEIIGLLQVLNEKLPNLDSVTIKAIDGNPSALRLLETILNKFKEKSNFDIIVKTSPIKIDDFYDMNILNEILDCKYDIIMSFKAVCEFVTKQQFEEKNAYAQISKVLLPKLKQGGLMLFVDVTTYNGVSQQWLPDMMDKGLSSSNCNIIEKNSGHNMSFKISHSRQTNDLSKIAWRLIKY